MSFGCVWLCEWEPHKSAGNAVMNCSNSPDVFIHSSQKYFPIVRCNMIICYCNGVLLMQTFCEQRCFLLWTFHVPVVSYVLYAGKCLIVKNCKFPKCKTIDPHPCILLYIGLRKPRILMFAFDSLTGCTMEYNISHLHLYPWWEQKHRVFFEMEIMYSSVR